jgi:hypothetical protein
MTVPGGRHVRSASDRPGKPKLPAQQTQVVLLGTGNPPADPDGTPYLVDFGAGVVRRAKSAVVDRVVAALDRSSCASYS